MTSRGLDRGPSVKPSHTATWFFRLTGVLLLLAAPAGAQQPPDPDKRFVKTEAMIRMRDGVRLHTAVYAPRGVKEPLPFLLLRTPYGIGDGAGRSFEHYLHDLSED